MLTDMHKMCVRHVFDMCAPACCSVGKPVSVKRRTGSPGDGVALLDFAGALLAGLAAVAEPWLLAGWLLAGLAAVTEPWLLADWLLAGLVSSTEPRLPALLLPLDLAHFAQRTLLPLPSDTSENS